MSMLPRIRARVLDRFIFNFRFPASALAARLPHWLEPQNVGGAAVASFCILDLDQVTFGPVPDQLGLRNVNCALRFGVFDRSSKTPAVYVAERNTNSRLGAFITSLGFPGHHRHVDVAIRMEADGRAIRVDDGDRLVLAARVTPGTALTSSQFASIDAFAAFIAGGVRSYCPSRSPGRCSVVDLHKDDPTHTPLAVHDLRHDLFGEWGVSAADAPLDSAIHTSDGRYVWEYIGQRTAVDESH